MAHFMMLKPNERTQDIFYMLMIWFLPFPVTSDPQEDIKPLFFRHQTFTHLSKRVTAWTCSTWFEASTPALFANAAALPMLLLSVDPLWCRRATKAVLAGGEINDLFYHRSLSTSQSLKDSFINI